MRYYLAIIAVLTTLMAKGQSFEEHFKDSTLRIDYIFAGNDQSQQIYVDELSVSKRWYGRRQHLSELPLKGHGSITITDPSSGDTIYCHSFSTLFQEWLYTEEAKQRPKAFENVLLIPYPKHVITVIVELRDFHNRTIAQLRHTIDPHDILIKPLHQKSNYVTLQQAYDTTKCIRVAFVAEGYKNNQMEQYLQDCQSATEALFRHEPFKHLRSRFHVIAVMTPSQDSDVSQPGENRWFDTALHSHFDTFYISRYLTTLHIKNLHDLLACLPYEQIIILANTSHYGGGGIYNLYNLSYTKGSNFLPVIVHEFGHSFGGLGDEYLYGDSDPMYFSDTEPWEPNLTTTNSYPVKWQALIDSGKASVIEGGGYLSKGVWRGSENCRMRTNEYPDFCPVCQDALTKLINFYTE